METIQCSCKKSSITFEVVGIDLYNVYGQNIRSYTDDYFTYYFCNNCQIKLDEIDILMIDCDDTGIK